MNRLATLVALGLAALSSGCVTGKSNPLPSGAAAYAAFPVLADPAADQAIRPGDHLSIRVLGEPELTSDAYIVDATGNIQVPLAGEVHSAGRSPSQLRDDLTQRLGSRFIRNPQVTVNIAERRRTTFAVEGDVREPGIFESTEGTTLLSAVAQAKSTADTAKLDEVMIFRVVDGQRMGARFNLGDIRKGRAADPPVLAGDTVVVGRSSLKDTYRLFIQAIPVFNLFYLLR